MLQTGEKVVGVLELQAGMLVLEVSCLDLTLRQNSPFKCKEQSYQNYSAAVPQDLPKHGDLGHNLNG